METNTLSVPTNDTYPNFARAAGDAIFSSYSQSPGGVLTAAQVQTLVKGGVVAAIAQAKSIFVNNPAFSALFTESIGIGEDGAYEGNAESETKAIASFSVAAGQHFSFDFNVDLSLQAKEIENADVEYNQADAKIAFLVLDTTNADKPRIVDFFGMWGGLFSSHRFGDSIFGSSGKVRIANDDETIDVDGNNGIDFVTGTVAGNYDRKFHRDTNLTLVEINASAIEVLGDPLIGNMGDGVICGTIWNDRLKGTNQGDRLYGSLGDDVIRGKRGDDLLEGGRGDDVLMGNSGSDRYYYSTDKPFAAIDVGDDWIVGFESGRDRIVLSRETFEVLKNTIGDREFAMVANDAAAAVSDAFITYSRSSGGLFYNQNGSIGGFGAGDRFATAEGIPALIAADFELA